MVERAGDESTRTKEGPPRLPAGLHVLLPVIGLVAFLAVSILVAVLVVLNLRADQRRLNERTGPYASAIATAALNAKGIANDERGFLLTGNPEFVDELNARMVTARTAFATAAAAADGPTQLRAVTDARQGFERWVAALRAELRTYDAGDRRRSISAAIGPGRALRKEYEASLAEAQAIAASALETQRSSVASASSRTVAILILCFLLAIGFGSLSLWLIRTTLQAVYAAMAVFGGSARAARRLGGSIPPTGKPY